MSSENINDGINNKEFESRVLQEMQKHVIFLEKELGKIRTGRANASLVEDVRIQAYDEFAPLKHLALITVPDSLTIMIQPFDTSILADIQNTLSTSEYNLNPKNDGKIIKISIPPLSQERRNECKKMVGKKSEEFLIQVRVTRQEYINAIKKAEKDKIVSQDFSQKLQKTVQQVYEKIVGQIEAIAEKKKLSLEN